ncbi:glycosyl transferase [Actinokineospora sp. NBRC 105648]|nr:glycosyl transferase [Actinokineospora sp. NBRC 105648]
MRVLLTTWAWPSHLYPMVPLGWALLAAGHDVRVAVGPALADAVNRAGLTPVTVTDEADLVGMTTAPALTSWHKQSRWTTDWYGRPELLSAGQREMYAALGHKQTAMAASMVKGVVDFAVAWRPDLVVHDAVTFAGLVAGAVLGVPSAATLWGNIALPEHHLDLFSGEPAADFVALFDRFGVAPKTSPDVWIDPCPPSMGLPSAAPRLPCRYVPYNGPGAAPDWLLEPPARRRVCLTWGITSGRIGSGGGPDVFDQVVDAVTELDAELVLALSDAGNAPANLPAGTRVVENLPLSLLLPSCAAVVHQGGGGTTMTSVWSGTPQLIVSPRPEQMMTGDRLEQLGAARHLVRGELAADPGSAPTQLRSALSALLDSSGPARAATTLRDDMLAQPSPADLVPRLTSLAEEDRSGQFRKDIR